MAYYLTRCKGPNRGRPKRSRRHPDRFREEGPGGSKQQMVPTPSSGKGKKRVKLDPDPHHSPGAEQPGKAKKGRLGSKKSAVKAASATSNGGKGTPPAPPSGRRNVKDNGDQLNRLLHEHWDTLENEYFRPLLPEDVVFLQGMREQLKSWAFKSQDEDEEEDEPQWKMDGGGAPGTEVQDGCGGPSSGGKKRRLSSIETEAESPSNVKRCSPEPAWDVVKCSKDDHGTILKFRRCTSPQNQAPPPKRLCWGNEGEGKKLEQSTEDVRSSIQEDEKEEEEDEEEENEDYDENLLSVEEAELMERLGELEKEVGSRLTSMVRYTKLQMKGLEVDEGMARTDRETEQLYKHLFCRNTFVKPLARPTARSMPPQLSAKPRHCRFTVGQEVEVESGDKRWMPATVVAVREAPLDRGWQVLVRRHKWDSRFDEWIMEGSSRLAKRSRVRDSGGPTTPAPAPAPTSKAKRHLNTSLGPDPRPNVNGPNKDFSLLQRFYSSGFFPTAAPSTMIQPPPRIPSYLSAPHPHPLHLPSPPRRIPLRSSDSQASCGQWNAAPPPPVATDAKGRSKLRDPLRQMHTMVTSGMERG